MRVRRVALGLVCIVTIGGLAITGCGSSGSGTTGNAGGNAGSGASNSGGSGGSSAGAGGATGGSGGSGGSAGSSSGGSAGSSTGGSGGGSQDASMDVQFTYDGPVDDGGFNTDASCAVATAEAKPLPLDMYIMLDQSGSMSTDCNVSSNYQASTGSKWCYAVNAIAGFMANSDPNKDIRAALQYFGLNNDTCNYGTYATPAINLTAIPAGAQTFINSLNSHSPSTNTPTVGAVGGLTQFTSNQKASNPNRTIIGILITDGDPNTCGNSTAVGNVISTAWNGGSGVRTYVIGMTGATYSNLETMAVGGGAPSHSTYCNGAGPCHYYTVGNGDYTTFTSVLSTIQASAIGCDYNMPTSDAGIIDPSKVSVEYTPNGTPPSSTVPKVANAAACPAPGGGQGGWYYDNPSNPTKITLCPATCQVVQADANAKVDVNLGCLGS